VQAVRFGSALQAAWDRRALLHESPHITAYRVVDGAGDDLPGIYLDRYGPALVLNVHDDAHLTDDAIGTAARTTLDLLERAGIESVYVKRFARDRSRLGGRAPDESHAATPRAGLAQPEAIVVREYSARFEIRLYDGFSTGLFLEHREHRRALAALAPPRALNLFAYTCAFAMPLAMAGSRVTNVDVSSRYLAWGRRNAAVNEVGPDAIRFTRMDALEYLAWAARRGDQRFELVILDPPTFAAGDARRGRRAWKASSDYPALVQAAVRVLAPGGVIFAATNARELATPSALAHVVEEALGRRPLWKPLPPWPVDVRERGRVAAVLFGVDDRRADLKVRDYDGTLPRT
jgi:23S rRNA (cytosine1962-C5)-methyltransferase